MFLSKKAQTSLEYVALAMFVVIGILVMGPYVIKSVNSYFKGTEDGVSDSYLEEFRQTTFTIPNPPDCKCTTILLADCGVNPACAPHQKAYRQLCDPIDCKVPVFCQDQIVDCCPFEPTGKCYNMAEHGPGVPPGANTWCPPGQEEFQRMCNGSPSDEWDCQTTATCQVSSCPPPGGLPFDPESSNPNKPKWGWCAGSGSPLAVNIPTRTDFYKEGAPGSCPGITQCEAECRSNWVPLITAFPPAGDSCRCPSATDPPSVTLNYTGWHETNLNVLSPAAPPGTNCNDDPEWCCPSGWNDIAAVGNTCPATSCQIDVSTGTTRGGTCP